MNIFGRIFQKKEKKIRVTVEPHPNDNKFILRHRHEINTHIEDLFNRVIDVKSDPNLTPEEKYAIILSTMMSITKMSQEMIQSGLLFKEKEYKKMNNEVNKTMNQKQSYFG